MKRVMSIILAAMILICMVPMETKASGASSEENVITESDVLTGDEGGNDYYRQFLRLDNPVFINLAEAYIDDEPQFYLSNSWSNILNEEYRRKGTFKNEYIYDMIIMGFLKFEADGDTYDDSLASRATDFAEDLYSFFGDELETKFEKSQISGSTNKVFDNIQTINDLNLAMSVVDYAGEAYESYLDIMASKMAILEAKREKIALFKASMDFASQLEGDDGYERVMDSIISAMEASDPTEYLNEKTESACWNTMLKLTEDIIKEINPVFAMLDLSVSGIDLVFNSSENASYDIKLAYLYLTERYLRNGMYSISEDYRKEKTPENAKRFIDSFRTLLEFQQYGNIYAGEWLDNYIKVRSGPIKRLFHKKEIQQANDMKEKCKSENESIEKMLKGINNLEKEEDTWKTITKKNDNENYISITDKLFKRYGELRIGPWLSEVEDPDGISREANGVCYLRLLDFDNDGDLELYAVCKNEEDENYTGYIYSPDSGMEPIFEMPVNSLLGYWNQNIELVCKEERHYVYVRDYPDGRGGRDIERLYGYNPDYPNHFSYTRFSSVEDSEWSDGTWHTEYMIRDDAVNGEWTIYDETEYNKTEEIWWSNAVVETSLCVRSSRGEIDENKIKQALEETMSQLAGDAAPVVKEEATDKSFKASDIENMDSISSAVIFHCVLEDLSSWNPSVSNIEDFWNIMCYYANAEERIDEMDPPRMGEYGEYMILPNSVFINAGYACFPDFSGELPQVDYLGDRVQRIDQNNTGVCIGDSIHMDRIDYTMNEDESIDAVYSYYDGEQTTEYKVHMTVNPDYDKANDYFTYSHTIERVERIEQNMESTMQNTTKQSSPFYGVWCGASKDEAGAENIATVLREKGLPADIYITTDWSDLNVEKWYVISAGTYDSKEEAEQVLPRVKDYFENAYVKYSGKWVH